MLRANPTLRSVAVLISLLAVCLIGAAILRVKLNRPVIMGGKMPVVRVRWSIPASGIRHVALSKFGNYICTISKDDEVACYDSTGRKLFTTVVAGADRAVISPDGRYILTYSYRNTANTGLAFLDATGDICWQMDVSGAVWSADAGLCKDGACFVVGTGNRQVYLLTVGHNTKRFRRWKVAGAACSVTLDTDNESVTCGTWQSSSVCRTNLEGRRDWEIEADPASLQYVQYLNDSDRLFRQAQPNNAGLDGEAALIEPDGTCLSSLPLGASRMMRALPSPDGMYVCVGYTKDIQHSGKSVTEKHAVLYDYSGRRIWDKGSILLQVTPLLVAKGGFVIISSGKKALLVINPSGEIKQACTLPAVILSSATSMDGSHAMITSSNGCIYCLSIIQ